MPIRNLKLNHVTVLMLQYNFQYWFLWLTLIRIRPRDRPFLPLADLLPCSNIKMSHMSHGYMSHTWTRWSNEDSELIVFCVVFKFEVIRDLIILSLSNNIFKSLRKKLIDSKQSIIPPSISSSLWSNIINEPQSGNIDP